MKGLICVRRSPLRTNRKLDFGSLQHEADFHWQIPIVQVSNHAPIKLKLTNKFPSHRFQITHQASWNPEVSFHAIISEIRPKLEALDLK